jgi:hypothetical protein
MLGGIVNKSYCAYMCAPLAAPLAVCRNPLDNQRPAVTLDIAAGNVYPARIGQIKSAVRIGKIKSKPPNLIVTSIGDLTMLHVVLLLEDTTIVADFRDGKWFGTCADNLSGQRREFAWTCEEFAAIAALAIGGEDQEEFLTTALYALANPLVSDWPREVRPIP